MQVANKFQKIRAVCVAGLFALVSSITLAVEDHKLEHLKAMSLEQLANLEVSIASKTPRSVEKVPAAVFVITQDDIRRSTASSVPELLRMVPGVNVARIDGSHWAISSRGFNGRFANKLLILMDGRTVYTPLFSGVYWNVQDTLLEDIERIEVIRGPGAAIWGANAVNGVINIITRSAEDTHGNLASVALGDPEAANVGFRHGGAINDDIDYRVFAKFRKNNELSDTSRSKANDSWHSRRIGFRLDGLLSADDEFTLQGDVYRNRETQTSQFPDLLLGRIDEEQTFDDEGGNVLARWQHSLSNSDETSLQLYYDYQRRDEADDKRHTLDMDFQYDLSPVGQHNWIMGLGYRLVYDKTKGQPNRFAFDPIDKTEHTYSLFFQDEIQLSEQWSATLGTKIEHNEYTHFEVQPSARLLWQPKKYHSVWLSVSRASRTPSRAETGISGVVDATPASFPLQPFPLLLSNKKSPKQKAETLMAYEMGYRFHIAEQLSLDMAGFFNDYSDLRTIEFDALDFSHLPSHIVQNVRFDNLADGHTWGVELSGDWRFAEKWRLQAVYSFLEMDLETKNSSTDLTLGSIEKQDPKHQLSLQLHYDPSYNWETDLWIRYVDEVTVSGEKIPQYWSLDARIGWQVSEQLELSLVGQNLFDASHPEYSDELEMLKNTEIPRGFFIKGIWNY